MEKRVCVESSSLYSTAPLDGRRLSHPWERMHVVVEYGEETSQETVPDSVLRVMPTMRLLHQHIETAAMQRLSLSAVSAQLSWPDGTPLTGASPQQLLRATIRCRLYTRAQLIRCEPLCGPAAGGTVVAVHGKGFCNMRETTRVRFGCVTVAVTSVESDTMLYCRSPPHPTGIASVRLLRCEDEGTGDDDLDTASFEFVRLEAAYDAIFASTNSFCPIRSRGQHEAEAYYSPAQADDWPDTLQ